MINCNLFFTWSLATVTGYVLAFTGITGIAVNTVVRNVFGDEGSCVILNCTCTSEIRGTWVGPRKSMTEISNDDEMPYTEGSVLNPSLNATNFNFSPNISTGECNLEIVNFSKFDEGTYKCQNLKALQTIVYVFKVYVQNHPKVIITNNMTNGTLYLECSSPEVPNKYMFHRLEHRSKFNEHVRFMNSSNDGYIFHTSITNAGLQDTGIYVCDVSYVVTDQNKTKIQSGKTLVEFEGAPVHLGGDIIRYANIGEDIIISTVIYNGHGKCINASIQSKRKIIHNHKINRSFVMVRKLFHGSNITLNASEVSFQLDLVTQKYFTKYILKICNKYGCTDIKINIKIDTSKNQESTRGKYQDVEIVIAALAVLFILAFGMAVVYWKKANNKDKSTLSPTEDPGEETQENRLFQSREIMNSDNPAHVLQAQAMMRYVYDASSSQAESTRNDQTNNKDKSTLSPTEDPGEETQENRLFQSREIMNSDNPAHVLQAQAMMRYVYDASSSQAESTRNDQNYLSGSHLNYSDVVFKTGASSHSNIIHGVNDKTIYSEIDLAQSTSFNNDGSDTSSDDDFIYIDGIVNMEKKNEIK